MREQKDKPFLKGIQSKVIAAFVLASTAILLALSITYYSFEGLLVTVDDLTTPNVRLKILNNLFHKITELDQQQRAEAIINPRKSHTELLKESQGLASTIDTLQAMHWESKEQLNRLHMMEEILHQRDDLFLSYLKLKSVLVYNKNLTTRLDTLSKIIAKSYSGTDTTITTTQKLKTTTTYLPSAKKTEKSTTFMSRLFGKKKGNETPDPRVEVEEELSVQIDTISIARQDSAIAEVERIMKKLENDQRLQNQQMLTRELELITANTTLINQLLNTLREVEKEEQLTQEANTEKAAVLVSTSIKRIGAIMIVFFLGAALLAFLILIDITRSNSLRKQLIHAKEEAEQLSLIKQRFLANMSHEIRTPLQSIIGFAEQLKQADSSSHAIEAIHSSSEHLLHIVNEVLDYSRLESGKLTIEREPFKLLDLIHEVKSVIGMQAERKRLAFILEVDAIENIQLAGDPFRLRQILYNLLGNAIKFTENGYVKLVVETIEAGNKIKCRFKIIDTGIGMHKEDLERAFQLFEQAHTPGRHQEGAGLGLTIVKKLVEAQGGTIQVESEPDRGSTFTVEICYEAAIEPTSDNLSEAAIVPVSQFRGKVMVVDDDPMILKLCSIILEKHKIGHVTFNDAEKALLIKPGECPELILLDIRMPRINGIDLCRELRKKVNHDTKIVALTAHVLPQERQSLLELGFDHVLTKPFRETDLLRLLGIFNPVPQNVPAYLSDPFPALNTLRTMTMGDEALFRSILSQFIEETQEDIVKLKVNLSDLNTNAVKDIVHKLAGRIGQIGLSGLSNQFKGIEDKLREGKELMSQYESVNRAIIETGMLLINLQQMEHETFDSASVA